MRRILILPAAFCALVVGCKSTPPGGAPAARIAAGNSLLECAAKDLLGESTPVLRLAEPGMCPGHFDIRPSQVAELRRCRVLLRLDFQQSLDAKLTGATEEGLRIVEVSISGGLCEPDSYLDACRQVAAALGAAGIMDRPAARQRLAAIQQRVDLKAAQCRRRTAALKDAPVLASSNQAAFCKWLGLKPVATFDGADAAAVGQVDLAVRQGEQAGARLVIANLPEGRRIADALAQRLGAKVVVFGNFPLVGKGQSSFDDLLADNVSRLIEATGK